MDETSRKSAMRTLNLRDVRKGSPPFDEEAFRTLLLRYGEGPPAARDPLLLDRLVRAAIPIIGEALSSYTGDLDDDVQDEMVQSAAIAVMQAIGKGVVDVDQNFHSYLRQRCRWRMLTVLQRGGPQVFDLDGGNVRFSSWIATLPGQAEVEMRLFLQQLQRVGLDTARRRCRFRGRAYQACLYIAERLLADQRVDLDQLPALGLTKPKFYRDYVGVILRDFLADFYMRYRPIFDENHWFEQTWVAGFFADSG